MTPACAVNTDGAVLQHAASCVYTLRRTTSAAVYSSTAHTYIVLPRAVLYVCRSAEKGGAARLLKERYALYYCSAARCIYASAAHYAAMYIHGCLLLCMVCLL